MILERTISNTRTACDSNLLRLMLLLCCATTTANQINTADFANRSYVASETMTCGLNTIAQNDEFVSKCLRCLPVFRLDLCQRFTAFPTASRRCTARRCCGNIITPTNKTHWLTLNYTETQQTSASRDVKGGWVA